MPVQTKSESTSSLLSRGSILTPTFERPIFIICAPRSGSTFLYHTIRRMKGLFSFGRENTPMWIRLFPYSRFSPPSDHVSPDECTSDAIAALKSFIVAKGVAHGFSFDDPDARDLDLSVALRHVVLRKPIRYIEKTIANCFHLEAIEKIFPDALYIYLVRDGRANVSSMIEGWNTFVKVGLDYPFPEDATVPYWSYALPPGWQETLHKPIEEICAWSWIEHNKYVVKKLETDQAFASKCLKIFYEDFVSDPTSVVAQISSFCNLEASPESTRYLNAKPLSRTTISKPNRDKWRIKNGEKIERVSDMICPFMEELGYADFS